MPDRNLSKSELRPWLPVLWCGQHGRWETQPGACDSAFDPDQVDWLVRDSA